MRGKPKAPHLRTSKRGRKFRAGRGMRIPTYAKRAAKRGLELRKRLPKSKKFGITQEQASRLGIQSGITRARRIIKNEQMPEWEVRKVARFGQRFRGCTTPKCEGAHLIWGGRKFERKAVAQVKRWNK